MLRRIVIGVIICPLLPGIFFDVLAMGRLLGIVTLVSAVIAYPVTFVVYMPVYFALAALKWRGIIVYSTVGTIMGFLIFALLPHLLYYKTGDLFPSSQPALRVSLLFGLIPTVVFWFLARPDLGTLKLSMSARKPAVQYVFLTPEAES
jgi:hypothetical protein